MHKIGFQIYMWFFFYKDALDWEYINSLSMEADFHYHTFVFSEYDYFFKLLLEADVADNPSIKSCCFYAVSLNE